MADVEVNGIRLHVVDEGAGEPVVFSHSYLVDLRQFDHQVERLRGRYRVVAYDHRDHGASARSAAPYDLDTLVDDAEALLEATGSTPCHWVGLSTGGFVGMRLALRSPHLLRSLTLMDTTGSSETRWYRLRNEIMLFVARNLSMSLVGGPATRLMLGRTVLGDPARREVVTRWRRRILANDPRALTRFGRAIFARDDVLDALRSLEVPTQVVVGEADRALPRRAAADLAAAIPGARLSVVPRAGHLCTIDEPEAVSGLLVAFLEEVATS